MPAIIITNDTALTQKVIDAIKTCYDPEIPVDIWELGLIYEINIDDEKNLNVKMTLTSPSCPVAETLPPEVEQKLREVEGIKSAKIELTFEPSWEKEMMSEVAQLELGFM
jgi:FeS assembly SUF system protein